MGKRPKTILKKRLTKKMCLRTKKKLFLRNFSGTRNLAIELCVAQSVSQFHGPTPRAPLHRLSIRLRRSRSTTSTEYSLPGGLHVRQLHGQLSQVRSVSPSEQRANRGSLSLFALYR